jgi:LysM repeat protein
VVSTQSTLNCSEEYTIVQGDTCSIIAQNNSITLAYFMSINDGINCKLLQIGSEVCVAVRTNEPTTSAPTTNIPESTSNTSTAKVTTTTPGSTQKATVPASTACKTFHVVVEGDTCSGIASAAGITLTILQLNNPTLDCARLQVGSNVCIDKTQLVVATTASPAACGNTYTTVTGDTCFSVASNFGLTLSQLQSMNPQVDCNALQVGVSFCLGKSTTAPVVPNCQKTYIIQAGDTCSQLAVRFNLTDLQFTSLNPNLICTNLQVGKEICVSVFEGTPAATRSANSAPSTIFSLLLFLVINIVTIY